MSQSSCQSYRHGCLGHHGIPYHFNLISADSLQHLGRNSSTLLDFWGAPHARLPGGHESCLGNGASRTVAASSFKPPSSPVEFQ